MQQHFKQIACVLLTISLVGCSSLGGGSVQKRANKLSNGLQQAYKVSPSTAQRLSPLIISNADRYDIDPLLIAAVIRQESTFRSQVTSPAGAVGLMQIIPRYWQNKCPGNLYDEATNISCGSSILMQYHDRAHDWKKALGYYNVGPSGYENNSKMKKQGKKYADQVKAHKSALKKAL